VPAAIISPRVELRALDDDEPPEYLRTGRASHLETHRVGRYTRQGSRHCQSLVLVDRSGPPGGCWPRRHHGHHRGPGRPPRRGADRHRRRRGFQAVTAQLYYRLVRRRQAAPVRRPPTAPRPSPPPAARRSAPTHDPSKNVSPRKLPRSRRTPRSARPQASLISAAEPSRTADLVRASSLMADHEARPRSRAAAVDRRAPIPAPIPDHRPGSGLVVMRHSAGTGRPLLLGGADQHLIDCNVPRPGNDVGDVRDVFGCYRLPELGSYAVGYPGRL
jgi:hypothetical protein